MYKKIMHSVKVAVYWSTLIGPLYSLIAGTIKGFVTALESIKAEAKLAYEKEMFDNPDEEIVDLSHTPEAQNFTSMVDMINRKGEYVNE